MTDNYGQPGGYQPGGYQQGGYQGGSQPGSYPPGSYPPGGYPQGQYGPQNSARTNPLAIVSLVLGIVQIIGFSLLASIPGLILGIIALKQVRTKGERGRGLAIAGVTLCAIGVLGTVILIIVVVASAGTHTS